MHVTLDLAPIFLHRHHESSKDSLRIAVALAPLEDGFQLLVFALTLLKHRFSFVADRQQERELVFNGELLFDEPRLRRYSSLRHG